MSGQCPVARYYFEPWYSYSYVMVILVRAIIACVVDLMFLFLNYSNLGFALLGRCLFQDDMSFEDHVTKYILQPLGMSDTGFDFTNE